MTIDDLKPGLRHRATLRVSEAMAVPAQGRMMGGTADMPPVFATANMIAFVEWTCVAALAAYLAPEQRTVGTKVEMTHIAATAIGLVVTGGNELTEIRGRRLRFRDSVRDENESIGDGFHERMIVDHDRFMARLARK